MPEITIDNVKSAFAHSQCLHGHKQVQQAMDRMATEITEKLSESNPLVLCVMTGGIVPAGHLLTRLSFPLQLDYIHATRYRGETRGGTISWKVKPSFALKDRTLLVIDDIFDEGLTLQEIVNYCEQQGAERVFTAVLVNKIHDRKVDLEVDFIGLDTEDKYLFGYGMDYYNYLRNAAGIYAVTE